MAHIQEIQEELQKLTENFRASSISITKKFIQLQSFVQLVQDLSPFLSSEDTEDFLESIEPTDFSSKRLKLELANQFKRPLIILEYIKTEEKLLVKRALQFTWIYKEKVSPLTNPKTLVRVILHSVSYSTRLKIINGISYYNKDEETCEEIFQLILQKYGSKIALNLLPACSISFIQNSLKTIQPHYVFMLSGKQSLRIAKKDVQVAFDFLRIIFDYIKSTENVHPIILDQRSSGSITPEVKKLNENQDELLRRLRSTHIKTIDFLATTEPSKFLELYQNYPSIIWFRASPKSTKVFISSCKEIIISDGSKFTELLCKKIVHKYLTPAEYVDFITSLLPNLIECFIVEHQDLVNSWLNPFPFKRRWETLEKAFHKKYGKEINSFRNCISPLIMELMPLELREKIALIKLERNDPGKITFTSWESLPKHREGFWIAFLPLDKSIPKIKELLQNESDVEIRSELLKCLIKTCWVNKKDKNALKEVCRFVMIKYRNDSQQLRNDFINELNCQFDLKNLMEEDELCEVLTDFIKLSFAYKEPQSNVLMSLIIRHRILKGLPLQDLEQPFADVILLNQGYWNGDFPRFSGSLSSLEVKYFYCYLNQLEKIYPAKVLIENFPGQGSTTLENAVVNILHEMTNKKLGKKFLAKFSIKNHTWLMKRLLEINEKQIGKKDKQIQHEIIKVIKSDPEAMDSYLKSLLETEPPAFVLNYYLKKNPNEVSKNIEKISTFILGLEGRNFKDFFNFFIQLKTQGFDEISSSIIEICLETAQDDSDEDNERQNALIILSYLWESRNYLNSISLFYPTSPIVDLQDDNFETQFSVRKSVVGSLKNTSFPSECLPSVFKFCMGDYMKAAVGPLYSSCLNCSQQEAVKFLKEDLLDNPVSVKKHAIKLLCIISEVDDLEEILGYLWDSETNLSIQEILTSQICTFMLHNFSKKRWKLVKDVIHSIVPKDKGSLVALLKPHNLLCLLSLEISSKYLSKSFQFVLSLFENLHVRDGLLQYFIHTTIQNISNVPEDFLEFVIDKLLFEFSESEEVSGLSLALTASFLLTPIIDEAKLTDRLSLIISKLSVMKERWNETKISTGKMGIEGSIIETDVTIYPARKALRTFVEEICKQYAVQLKTKSSLEHDFSNILLSILEALETNFDSSELFTEIIYLKLSVMFKDYVGSEDGESSDFSLNEKILFDVGQKLQKETDLLVSKYHAVILCFLLEKVKTFFEEIFMFDEISIIYLVLGIIAVKDEGDVISLENQMLACQLMPNIPSKTPLLESKHNQLVKAISLFTNNNSIRIILSDKLVQT